MRLFLAVELAASVRAAIAAWLEDARRGAPPARWIRPEQMHLTLRFLSEVARERVGPLREALRGALARRHRLTLQVGGGGAFPARGRVRVLWLGVRAEGDLEGLQSTAASAAEGALGLPPEERPFHPHLTVARCRAPWPRRRAERWLEQVPDPLEGPFPVRDVALLRSDLEPAGARYTTVERFRLGKEG